MIRLLLLYSDGFTAVVEANADGVRLRELVGIKAANDLVSVEILSYVPLKAA